MSSHLTATQREQKHPLASGATLLSALPQGALLADCNGIIQQVNRAAAALLGVEAHTLPGGKLADLPGGTAFLPTCDEQTGTIEVDGRALYFDARPLFAEDGASDIVGTLILLHDRTAELATKHEQYEQIARALHDVRVPLQAIGGAADGLLRGWFGPLADEQREFVTLIKENASRQGILFSNLFDLYTLIAGVVELQVEPLQLEGLLQEVEHEVAARFEARGVSLTVDLPSDLPQLGADRRRLRQVLLALLDNACKYTLSGGAVVMRVAAQGDHLRLDIVDTGVGIRTADQASVFRPFFRGESPLKEGRYGGLSLSIAQMLIALHGGWLSFTSVEGQGSTFSFTLPITSLRQIGHD
jgi:signal transduction histidine kinase